MNTHRAQVRRSTRAYQLGALALLAAAGAAVALPLGKALGPPPPATPSATVEAPVTDASKAPLVMEPDEAADVLKALMAWKPAPPEPPPEPAPDATPAPVPTPSATEWAYLGSVMVGRSSQALVRVNTDQHMLRPGQKHGDTKLLVVEPRFITVETAGQEKRIDLLARANIFPTDPPKRGLTPRGPAANVSGAINPAAMNQNGMVKNPAHGNFDQLRAQAEEAAKKRAMAPPGRPSAQDLDLARQQSEADAAREKLEADPTAVRDRFEKTIKQFAEGNMSVEQRVAMLRDLGIPPGANPEDTMERFRGAGINPDEYPDLLEAAKANARGNK